MEYSVNPPDFEKYISRIDFVKNENILIITVDMRVKRIPFFCQIERDEEGNTTNLLKFVFDTEESEDSNIIYPQSLEKWTGNSRPTIQFELDHNYELEFQNEGRYSKRVCLSKNIEWQNLMFTER